jgi:FG-GAP repeat
MTHRVRLAACSFLAFAGAATAQSVLFTVNGDNASDTLGQSIDIVGDVDFDGYADFMVGAWRDDNNGKVDSGSVRVVSGKTGATIWVINGDLANDHMGYGSSGAGDVNGDGRADICAAADEADQPGLANVGTAKIVDGATGATIWLLKGDTAGDFFGWSSAHAGDVDGDGFSDVVCGNLQDDDGAKTNCGSIWVFSGATGLSIFRKFGGLAGDAMGDSCGGVGDVNGDGRSDVIGGAPSADPAGTGSGTAIVYSGIDGSVLYTVNGIAAADNLGGSVAGAGDVDLDGVVDFVVGAGGSDVFLANAGTARVFSGATGALLHALHGESAGDNLGGAVDGAGDVDGDGYGDIATGATGDDNNGASCGALRVFSGKNGAILFTGYGDSASDVLGTSVSGGYDMDGDGLDDVVAGATGDDNNGAGSGSARAYSLRPTGVALFGSGTAGCAGKQILGANGVPAVGNASFALIGNIAPASSVGYLLVSSTPNLAGTQQPGLGAILHVALPPVASFLLIGNSFADAKGSFLAPVPLPADPLLAGFPVSFQTLSAWPSPCPGLPATQVSSSNGLTITIQP